MTISTETISTETISTETISTETISTSDRVHSLAATLRAQFDRHADELARLTTHSAAPEHIGLDPHTVATLIDSTRQALADTTEALKRMNNGTYGRCERCGVDIPAERLEILPHARFCVPCQQTHRG